MTRVLMHVWIASLLGKKYTQRQGIEHGFGSPYCPLYHRSEGSVEQRSLLTKTI